MTLLFTRVSTVASITPASKEDKQKVPTRIFNEISVSIH